jgi:hypothetical protein
MSLLRHFVSPKYLFSVVLLSLAAPLAAQPRVEVERAEIVRQLNESRERVRKLEERLRVLDAQRSQPPAVAQRAATNCDIPFVLDQEGVKHFKLECLVSAPRSSCEANPFTVGDDGIKRIRPGCAGESLIQNRESH